MMQRYLKIVSIFAIFLQQNFVTSLLCTRFPKNTWAPKSPVDENFVVSVSGNPQTYILGQEYNISISAFNGLRFISFILALENDEGDSITYRENLGHFEILDPVETRYNPKCANMVENTNNNPKTRIDVKWVAPQLPGGGCVLIRATLLQHRDVWYMDDGGLTKRICEEVTDELESQKLEDTEQSACCACDEARYKLTFEGVWSRNLHPKDFPEKSWLARFADIVGASHSGDYRFWEYGKLASPAMQEYAEHGSTLALEKEFNANFKNGAIRTIIKARGPAFPNLNGQSVASVRVDPQHHLISLAAKIEPSPDWILGLSGLELCMSNCTWLDQRVINLYPWDIGTDAGPSYASPDQPQVPSDVIRRIRSDFPNDPRSPFFDVNGAPLRPLATLTIRKLRLYERQCQAEESNNNENVPRECLVHPWTAWSECTTKCGEGTQYRTRIYKQPEVAKIYNCNLQISTREDRACQGNSCVVAEDRMSYSTNEFGLVEMRETRNQCELSSWSIWSACNATCGEGYKVKTRYYLNVPMETQCQNIKNVLIQYQKCMVKNCIEDVSEDDNSYNRDVPRSLFYTSKHEEPTLGDILNNNQNVADELENYNEANVGDIFATQTFNQPNGFEVGNLKLEQTYFPSLYPQLKVAAYCFEPLQLFPCLDSTVKGNFWFYNYCEDRCMLFTADNCDRNSNKFNSMEMCEIRCRQPDNIDYLKRKQQKDCQIRSEVGRKRNRRIKY